MTRARRMLDWAKQISLAIDPEEAARIHNRDGQLQGNSVPCTMCGSACVYIMLPQQRRYEVVDGEGGGGEVRGEKEEEDVMVKGKNE
ncbi:Phosphomethylpyrimidine synthase [archaeon HR04]|nr:Phosphomethylpyrimidine synthase [archaeon HR04]